MGDATFVFAAGITGVFLGMTCLYASIKVISFLTTRWAASEDQP